MIDLIQGVLACLQDGCWREGCVLGLGVRETSGGYKGRSIWLCISDIGHIIRVGNKTNRHVPVSPATQSRNQVLILSFKQWCLLDDCVVCILRVTETTIIFVTETLIKDSYKFLDISSMTETQTWVKHFIPMTLFNFVAVCWFLFSSVYLFPVVETFCQQRALCFDVLVGWRRSAQH